MRVFNLTDKPLDYRGRTIPPSGGFLDFPDLSFVPDRDLRLQETKILAFGKLPGWFETQQKLRRVAALAEEVAEVTGEFPLSRTPFARPADVQEEDTLIPIPVPTPLLVEKKLGRKKKHQ